MSIHKILQGEEGEGTWQGRGGKGYSAPSKICLRHEYCGVLFLTITYGRKKG